MSTAFHEDLKNVDQEVAELLVAEKERQMKTICLIPSENYCSKPVSHVLNSYFMNKYSEGYPHLWKEGERKHANGRYYQGQEFSNRIEALAIQRALELFTPNPDDYHANVQPLSGSPANLAVLNAFLNPGDPFMGLALDFGGHLTHGHKVSVTGRYYRSIQYGLDENGVIDYEQMERLAAEYRPKLIFCGATAYPLEIDFERISSISKRVGAIMVADISHICGLCIKGLHQHPFPHADVVTSTTHKILRGPRAGVIIAKKQYGEQIDKSVFPGLQGGPHMNTIAAMAVAFKEALSEEYHDYVTQVAKNAKRLADNLKNSGFKLVGDGTENHLILIDLKNSRYPIENGSVFAKQLELAGIVVNKNSIPGDKKPWIPSGIRLGTPAVTTIGMKEQDMDKIADWIVEAAKNLDNVARLSEIRTEVEAFMKTFSENDYF